MQFIEPMLCQTGSLKDLERSGFIGEEKYDGTRVLIIKYPDGSIRLQNRHGIDYTYRLTEFVEAAKMLRAESFIIDGEAVYRDPSTGKIDFQPCQRRCSTQDIGAQMFLRQKYPLKFIAFDILLLNQEWQIDKPLLERKQVLRKLLPYSGLALEYVPHRYDLRAFFDEVKARGDEGLIIKRVDSKYRLGERSYDWLKIKNWREEICNIVGYTIGEGSRNWAFGSLVLSQNGRYVGKVGSGFSDFELRKLKDLLLSAPKVAKPFEIDEDYVAVQINLRVKVKFYKRTEDNVLRFPVFEGILTE